MKSLACARLKTGALGKKSILFGTTARPLHEQLGCDKRVVLSLQYYADAVQTLGAMGILTPFEVRKAEERIVKRIPERLMREVTE